MPAAIHSLDTATVAELNAPLVAPYATLNRQIELDSRIEID